LLTACGLFLYGRLEVLSLVRSKEMPYLTLKWHDALVLKYPCGLKKKKRKKPEHLMLLGITC